MCKVTRSRTRANVAPYTTNWRNVYIADALPEMRNATCKLVSPAGLADITVSLDPIKTIVLMPIIKFFWQDIFGADLVKIPEASELTTTHAVHDFFKELNKVVRKVFNNPSSYPEATRRVRALQSREYATAQEASVLADVAFNMEVESDRALYKRRNRTEQYGELTTYTFAQMLKKVDGKTFVDIGMGAGTLVFTAAAMGFEAMGVEIVEARFKTAKKIVPVFENLYEGIFPKLPAITLRNGSILETETKEAARKRDIIFVNNFVFDEKLNTEIDLEILRHLKEKSTVISSALFGTHVRKMESRVINRRTLGYFGAHYNISEEFGDVTWTHRSVKFFKAVKKTAAEREALVRQVEEIEEASRKRKAPKRRHSGNGKEAIMTAKRREKQVIDLVVDLPIQFEADLVETMEPVVVGEQVAAVEEQPIYIGQAVVEPGAVEEQVADVEKQPIYIVDAVVEPEAVAEQLVTVEELPMSVVEQPEVVVPRKMRKRKMTKEERADRALAAYLGGEARRGSLRKNRGRTVAVNFYGTEDRFE